MTIAQVAVRGREHVTVVVGNQLFGIPIEDVEDVFRPHAITNVPLAPPEVGGVLNLRGHIVTAIDMRRRLGMPPRGKGDASMAVGIAGNGESYGLIVDNVGEVLGIDPGEIEPSPDNLDAKWRAVSKGVYPLQDRLLIVLDVELLMNFNRSGRVA